MFRGIEGIMINSENAKALAEFYEKKVGLEMTNEFTDDAEDEVYEFGFKNGPSFAINQHSEIHGHSKEPRMFINLEVNDIEKAVAALDEKGIKKIQDIYHVEGYGLVSTFEDLDGNLFQLVQVRPTESE
jgi:predicted enzyme related to lactoylglutathione lyase